MGSNITPKSLFSWMNKNGWLIKKTTNHNIAIYKEKLEEPITIGSHRTAISEKALKDIARVMEIDKQHLVECIRRKNSI